MRLPGVERLCPPCAKWWVNCVRTSSACAGDNGCMANSHQTTIVGATLERGVRSCHAASPDDPRARSGAIQDRKRFEPTSLGVSSLPHDCLGFQRQTSSRATGGTRLFEALYVGQQYRKIKWILLLTLCAQLCA